MNTTRVNLRNGLFLGAALILLALGVAVPQIAEAAPVTTKAGCSGMSGTKKRNCEQCVYEGGSFIDEGSSSQCRTNSDTEDCTYGGDLEFCLLCFGGTGWNRSDPTCVVYGPSTKTKTTIGSIRSRASSMKKAPLTSIPDDRLTPRLRALKAKQILINNQQKALPQHKVGTVQPRAVQKQGQTQKQKSAITKPTRPGVPMPTEPIRPGKPMAK